jgi:hypothetical protein
MRKLKYVKLFENFTTTLSEDGHLNEIQAMPSSFGKYRRYVFGNEPLSFKVDSSVKINDREAYLELAKIVGINIEFTKGNYTLLNVVFLPEFKGFGDKKDLPYVTFYTEGFGSDRGGKESIMWVGNEKEMSFVGGMNISGKPKIAIENILLEEAKKIGIFRCSTKEEKEFDEWLLSIDRNN